MLSNNLNCISSAWYLEKINWDKDNCNNIAMWELELGELEINHFSPDC